MAASDKAARLIVDLFLVLFQQTPDPAKGVRFEIRSLGRWRNRSRIPRAAATPQEFVELMGDDAHLILTFVVQTRPGSFQSEMPATARASPEIGRSTKT